MPRKAEAPRSAKSGLIIRKQDSKTRASRLLSKASWYMLLADGNG
jgi:hypothetical protein